VNDWAPIRFRGVLADPAAMQVIGMAA